MTRPGFRPVCLNMKKTWREFPRIFCFSIMGRLPQAVAGVTLLAILSGCSILLRQPAQPKFPNYPKNDLERMARAVGACFCVCVRLCSCMRLCACPRGVRRVSVSVWFPGYNGKTLSPKLYTLHRLHIRMGYACVRACVGAWIYLHAHTCACMMHAVRALCA